MSQSNFLDDDIDKIERLQNTSLKLLEEFQKDPFNTQVEIEYLHTMYALLEQQQIVFTRLVLTGDKEAQHRIENVAVTLGMIPGDSVNTFLGNLKKEVVHNLELLTDEDFPDIL